MERITKDAMHEAAQNVNRRLRPVGTPASVRGHYVLAQGRCGYVGLDEYVDGACVRTIMTGTKREVTNYLRAMCAGIDMFRNEFSHAA